MSVTLVLNQAAFFAQMGTMMALFNRLTSLSTSPCSELSLPDSSVQEGGVAMWSQSGGEKPPSVEPRMGECGEFWWAERCNV